VIGGWFPDPDGAPGRLRWWDGARWTEHTTAANSPEALAPPRVGPPPSWWRRLLGRADPPIDDGSSSSFEPWAARGPASPYDGSPHGADPRPPASGYAGVNDPTYGASLGYPAERVTPSADESAGGAAPYRGGPPIQSPPPARDGDVIVGHEPSPRASRAGSAVGTVAVIAALIAAVVFGVLHVTGGSSSDSGPIAGPTGPTDSASLSPLQRLCQDTGPAIPDPHAQRAPAPTGPRIDDPTAGISYAELPAPFQPWEQGAWDAGTLGEQFSVGQYFVTQAVTPQGGPYLATVLSGTVPAAYGDNPHPNIECAGKVVAADVQGQYYPAPNTRTDISADRLFVDGHPAYLIEFHLSFDEPGYDAKGELVAVCVIDVDQPHAAVVYISIPDTHRQYDSVISQIIDSVRVGR
jgi:hypothetical protein